MIGIFSIIKLFIEGLCAYFRFKADYLSSKLVRESEDRQIYLINQIESERDKKTEQSAQKGDFLRSWLEMEKKKYEKLVNNL